MGWTPVCSKKIPNTHSAHAEACAAGGAPRELAAGGGAAAGAAVRDVAAAGRCVDSNFRAGDF